MIPTVSIVIPVGPGHAHYLPKALASVEAQTVREWEYIVIDDTDEYALKGDDWLTTSLYTLAQNPKHQAYRTSGRQGAGHARNKGLNAARAPWTLFLDADDELMPRALEHLLRGAEQHPEASYIYGDWWNVWDGREEYYQAPEYDQRRFLNHNLHVVTALYPTKVLREIGGFDGDLRGYEDWELNLRLAMLGYCGKRVPQPTIVYRTQAGFRREWSRQNEPELIKTIRHERYGAYLSGERQPAMCCGQIQSGQTPQAIAQQFGLLSEEGVMSDVPMVRMEYTGTNEGFIPYRNPFGGSGATYRGGVGVNRYAEVHPVDVAFLEGTGVWRKVEAGNKNERPRRDMEAVIVHSAEGTAQADQAAADELVAAGDVEMPKRKGKAKDGD